MRRHTGQAVFPRSLSDKAPTFCAAIFCGTNHWIAFQHDLNAHAAKASQSRYLDIQEYLAAIDCKDPDGRLLRARPFGFLERFDPHFTPNTTDMDGLRYTFRNQPTIGQWNLAQLATALITGGLLEQASELM